MKLNSIFQYFTPKNRIFYTLFEEAGNNLITLATTFKEELVNFDTPLKDELHARIQELEQKGDELTHSIFRELSSNFITPFDREDIHALANALDDIADNIQGGSNRMTFYQVRPNEVLHEFADILLETCIDLNQGIHQLQDLRNLHIISETCAKVKFNEKRADRVFDQAVADLFANEKDAIELFKKKEIFSTLETATDRCEDASDVLESILIKYS